MERRISWTRIVVLSVVVIALMGTAGAAASQTPGKRALNPRPSVVTPRSGERLPAKPVLIKIYLGAGRFAGASLNGRGIGSDLLIGRPSRLIQCAHQSLADSRGRSCQLLVSPSDGLRYGGNLLRVQFKLKRSVDTRTVRFWVADDRPIAAAGRDQLFAPGDTRIRLNGRASLMPPARTHKGKRRSLRYRWEVVQAPLRAKADLAGANTPTPAIVLDAAGKYTVRLTVTAPDGRTGTDLVTLVPGAGSGEGAPTVAAPDAAPLVSVETMVKINGKWGVELGSYGFIDHPPPGCTDRSSVGYYCFYADPGNGQKWLQLLVLDRGDLSVVHNDAIDCPEATQNSQEHNFDFLGGGDVYSHNQNRCISGLDKYLETNTDGNDLVIAVNQPGDATNMQEQPPVGAGAALSGKFIQPVVKNDLGIGASGWFDAPGNGRDLAPAVRGTFSAVGVPGWTTGGVWRLAEDPGNWNPEGAGRLLTHIAVDNAARYAPLAPTLQDQADSPIAKVLTQAPTDWPPMTEGQAHAFSAIGQKALLTADPRTFYYTAPDTEDWGAKLSYVSGLDYHDLDSLQASPPFTEDDFAAAKKELKQELFWLTQANTYVRTLAEPYDVAQGTLWANVGKAASTIVNTDTSNGTGEKAFAIARNVVESVVDLIPGAGGILKWSEGVTFAAEAVTATYHTAVDVAETANGEPADDEFPAATADLGSELANRLSDAQREIKDRFFNIVVSDYGKLRTVALCSGGSSECDDHQHGWSVTKNGVTKLDQVLEIGLERELFTSLVPVKYPLALALEPVSEEHKSTALNDAAEWCKPFPPFEHTTGVYLWTTVDRDWWTKNAPGFGMAAWAFTPIVLTTGDPGFAKTWHAASWSVFGRMFDGLDPGGNLEKGGLGIDEQQFMAEHYGLKDRYILGDHFQPYERTALSSCSNESWPWG